MQRLKVIASVKTISAQREMTNMRITTKRR